VSDHRHEREAAHFDAGAEALREEVLARPIDRAEHVRRFLAPERFVARAMELMGEECGGLTALDLGGGGGSAAVVLADRGARVVVCDLSGESLKLGAAQAAKYDVAGLIHCVAADGCRIPLADHSVDRVLGLGILHHLGDPAAAGREVARVLKPGGRAVFTEPLSGNPLLGLARAALPYRKKHRSDDEHPLTRAEITAFLSAAGGGSAEVFDFTAMIRRLFANTGKKRGGISFLESVDKALFAVVPPLKRWARYCLISIPAASAGESSGSTLLTV
jgi:ubiquinone/menaquinone biosynthesis C-methylase UbiE